MARKKKVAEAKTVALPEFKVGDRIVVDQDADNGLFFKAGAGGVVVGTDSGTCILVAFDSGEFDGLGGGKWFVSRAKARIVPTPAQRKLCTECRWHKREASRFGERDRVFWFITKPHMESYCYHESALSPVDGSPDWPNRHEGSKSGCGAEGKFWEQKR